MTSARETQNTAAAFRHGPESAKEIAEEEWVPLTDGQQRLWFLEQLEPHTALYNFPLAWRLLGGLDRRALERAFHTLASRHDALRTRFASAQGRPRQCIAARASPEFNFSDLRHLALSEANLKVRLEKHAQRPFDLERGPLWRVELARLGAQEHALLIVAHHLICDAWSLGILCQELGALYGAFHDKMAPSLPPLPIRFAEFARQQSDRLQGAGWEEQLRFWKSQWQGQISPLNLPADRPRPGRQSFGGSRWALPLSMELINGLQSFGRRLRASLFMVLLAVFKVLLYRRSRQEDIVVGTVMANRSRPETEPLMGFLTNTLALRSRLSGSLSFVEHLSRVRAAALSAYEHWDLPFERLVEALQPERSLTRHALFQVLFVFHPAEVEDLVLSGVEAQPLDVHTGTAKFDLTLSLRPRGQAWLAEFEYNTDLFNLSTIEAMGREFESLLEGILAQPECRIDELPLLPAAELRQVTVDWNRNSVDFERGLCLHQLFERQVRKTPEAQAVICERDSATYAALDIQAEAFARELRTRGAGPETVVGICAEPSIDRAAALLGILKAGAAYLPLDPEWPKERNAFLQEETGVLWILTRPRFASKLAARRSALIYLEASDGAALSAAGTPRRAERQFDQARPENLAYILYTSGSTGRPKGVCVTHRSAVSLMAWARHFYNASELKGVLAATSLCFDLSVFELFAPLSCGGTVILAQNPLQLPALPARNQITLINTVPSAMAELLRLKAVPRSVQTVNLAGEPLSRKMVGEIYEQTEAEWVFDLYGPTEDTVYSTGALRSSEGHEVVGRPLSNKEVYILDPRLQPVPIGVTGELFLGGDGLARGYLKRPELTAEKFLPHPWSAVPGARLYATGDLGRFRPDGQIELQGRKDQQFKIRGFRIEAGEIEANLRDEPSVRECAVSVWPPEGNDRKLVAYVCCEPNDTAQAPRLRDFLAGRVPGYMIPSVFLFLEALPRTANGKIDRRALPAPDDARPPAPVSRQPPRSEFERIIGAVWMEVLEHDDFGLEGNFFELGGHSLLVTRVVARLRDLFQTEIPIRLVFEQPTLAGLAKSTQELVRGQLTAEEWSAKTAELARYLEEEP